MKPKKENKKGGAIVSLIVGIIFVLLAIMCFIGDMDYLLGGKAKDLNEIAANVRPQKDDHVRTDSYLVLGNFAETKHYINGIIPAGKEQHYAIVLGDDNMDDITDAKMIVLGALAIGVLCIIAFAKINKQIKNEKNLAYTNATPAMGQPGNPYVNPVTGQPYDAGVVNPVTGQAYNQTPDAGYGQAPNQTYNQTPDGAPSVPYTPGQNTDNNPYS